MRRAAALALLTALAAAPAPAVQRMGPVELAYDPAVFVVSENANGGWTARPVDEQEGQALEITADTRAACSEAAMAALVVAPPGSGRVRATTVALPSGLTVHYGFGSTGCRNATAGPTAACVRHAGSTVLFRTPPNGCDDSAYADHPPEALLQGLRPG